MSQYSCQINTCTARILYINTYQDCKKMKYLVKSVEFKLSTQKHPKCQRYKKEQDNKWNVDKNNKREKRKYQINNV